MLIGSTIQNMDYVIALAVLILSTEVHLCSSERLCY